MRRKTASKRSRTFRRWPRRNVFMSARNPELQKAQGGDPGAARLLTARIQRYGGKDHA
jgi:hypothetical protein